MTDLVLAFDEDAAPAGRLADALRVPRRTVLRHRFPDGELKLTLPVDLPPEVVLYRSLHPPNERLVELMILAPAARELGARTVSLACPYLAYMRQDIAFRPGEAVSQRHVSGVLGGWFDRVVTVDPHLHRTPSLQPLMPHCDAVAVSAAPLLGQWAAARAGPAGPPLLLAPDEEAGPWVAAAAAANGLDHAHGVKQRRGDRDVAVVLPPLAWRGRAVVLVDDVASTGHTLAQAAAACLAAGTSSVDVAVTHGLFVDGATDALHRAGVREICSSDSVAHPSNQVALAALLARALRPV